MSAKEFYDALEAPDNSDAHTRLSQIMDNGVSAGAASPDTAQTYLRTFCDRKCSFSRRRWVGLALCKMLQSSEDVVTRLKGHTQGLTGIGNVILNSAELEETKIVAGLIIREGLAWGIKFLSFWPNDKVMNSASNFPRDAGPSWMSDFQSFLETLVSLHLMARVCDCDLFYVVSTIATDGYKLKAPNDIPSLLLIQRGLVTIMRTDPILQNFHLVDIPLSHILDVHQKKTALHDSQNRRSDMEPSDIVVKLKADSWTYRVNSARHSGDELSITFLKEEDAADCQSAISSLVRSLRREANSDRLSTHDVPDDVPEEAEGTNITQGQQRAHKDTQENKTSVSAPQKQPVTSKTGKLPTVSKPSSSGIAKPSFSLHNNEDLAFPEQSSPARRPIIKRRGGGPTPISGRKTVGKGSSKADTTVKINRAKPKPEAKPQDPEMNDTEDDEDPLSETPIQKYDVAAPLKPDGPGAAATPSSLPKVMKKSDTRTAPAQRAQSDVFAIPPEEEADPVTQTKRKRGKPVTYKNLDDSEEESSGSEYRESKKRKTRSPTKRFTITTVPRQKRALRKSQPNGKMSNINAISSGAESHPVKSTKPPLVSQSILKSQPMSGARLAKPKERSEAALGGKENTPRTADNVATPAKFSNHDGPASEIDVLNRLNRFESNSGPEVQVGEASARKHATASLKRPLGPSQPKTPTRAKRTKLNQTLKGEDDKSHGANLILPPPTGALLRVLAEPSSPCNKQDRETPRLSKKGSEHSMQAPTKPTPDELRTATYSRRRRMLDSSRGSDTRLTPLHRLGKRTVSGGSANLELLSSNSKPTPASPHAESTAISGHADPEHVQVEREMSKSSILRNDPFIKPIKAPKLTSFTRRLTGDEEDTRDESGGRAGDSLDAPIQFDDEGDSSDTSSEAEMPDEAPKGTPAPALVQKSRVLSNRSPSASLAKRSRSRSLEVAAPKPLKQARLDVDVVVKNTSPIRTPQPVGRSQLAHTGLPEASPEIDGDTLVEHSSLPDQKASPVFGSSPPPLDGSPSSYSSTSAEDEPRTDPPIHTSEAETMSWEASLQPHQRFLREQLLRVSTRVVRHVVDNETAVDGIVDTYARDGKHLLKTMAKRHDDEFAAMYEDVRRKRERVRKSAEGVLQRVQKEREELDE